MDFQQFLQSPGGSPLLYGKVYGMSFGLPWQQVRSILPAHCDSWGILCLDVFYGCVLMGQASPPSCFPGLSSLLFTLAPPLAQRDTTGFTRVIWNASPSDEVSHLLEAFHGSEGIGTKLWVAGGWLSPAKSAQVEKMHVFVSLHIFYILTVTSLSPVNIFLFLLDFSG